MNASFSLPVLVAAALLGAAPTQEALAPIKGSQLQPAAGQPAASFDATAAAKALRSDDLKARLEAYEGVLRDARHDEGVRATLERWSQDTGQLELAWTAQLLLRELQARPATKSWDPFHMAPFTLGFPKSPFGDLDDLFEELLPGGRPTFPGQDLVDPGQGFSLPPGSSSRSEGFSMESGPEGVRVELRKTVDGEEQVQTYEADSLQELLQAHPELEQQIQAKGHLGSFHLGGSFGGLQSVWRTDRLGVQVLDSQAFTRRVPGLSEGVGLEVVRVLPGSLAEALGLRVGDVVTYINGKTIHSAQDVKSALAERLADEEVSVEVIDEHDVTRTCTWSPEPEAKGTPKPLVPIGK